MLPKLKFTKFMTIIKMPNFPRKPLAQPCYLSDDGTLHPRGAFFLFTSEVVFLLSFQFFVLSLLIDLNCPPLLVTIQLLFNLTSISLQRASYPPTSGHLLVHCPPHSSPLPRASHRSPPNLTYISHLLNLSCTRWRCESAPLPW